MPDDFGSTMSRAHVSALWQRTNSNQAELSELPYLWPWTALSPLLDKAVGQTDMDNAERRVLILENPAYRDTHRSGASLNMVVNLQILMPGEVARAHRHRLNALRFVIESDGGAVTTVDGFPCAMHPGDLLLTPGWCWHGHTHDGHGRAVWLDALDAPLQRHFCTDAFEAGPMAGTPPPVLEGAYGAPGIAPIIADTHRPYSPIFRYPLKNVCDAMAAMPAAPDGSRRIRYTDPKTGGAAMPGVDCYMLAPGLGSETRPYRTTANMVCLAVEGEGVSRAGDEVLHWRKNDIFSLPRGHWITHRSDQEGAKLFQLTDREVLAKLDYLREEFQD